MLTKNIMRFVQVVLMMITVYWYLGCNGSDDGSMEPLSVISFTLNGSPIVDNSADIPVDSSFEIVFSTGIDPKKFENLFFLTAGSQDVPVTLQYLNQSTKVLVTAEQIPFGTTLVIGINSGEIGQDGDILTNTITYMFTTVTEDANSKTPCLSASQECLQQLVFMDGSNNPLSYDVYANYDFVDDPDYVYDFVDQVMVVVHGAERNADEYYGYMLNALKDLGLEKSTLVIAPHFQDDQSAELDGLVWNDSRWREGANASNTNTSISSFTVMDTLVNRFSNLEKFPNLKTVFIAGHSSGATFAQHYALANKVHDSHSSIDFQYVVANNQYFCYPDGQRFNEGTDTFYTPMDCTGYTFWPYGYEFSVPYIDGIDTATLTEQQVTRNTNYFLGSEDTSTTGTLNTTDCQATLLGSNRLKRGENIFNYMETFFTDTHQHRKIIVPGIGHDANGMFNSPEFKQFVMEFQ